MATKKGNENHPTKGEMMKTLNNAFHKYGPEHPNEILKQCKPEDPAAFVQFVNDFALRSEKCELEKLSNTPEFIQCVSWSELLDSKGFRETCNNELPVALRSLAYTEKFPKPENAHGVDFQLLYLNLSYMMMGQPIQIMNQATRKLLKQVYEETVLQRTKSEYRTELLWLQEKLKTLRLPTKSTRKTLIMKDLKLFFADPNINPLQLPLDKICFTHPK
ncbi:uncharacterized protein LOC118462503 [Anopheles albimanus]|uniref:Uncharacterized protein n=1 Tax=Anopheles albimanus TaxID=7167 RepID=A0A8W7JHF9_ANOAL|nr:uncharacterized protein LOC118462503 [Anopheles albimanus]XP_035784119.1 uncharacterized protein LOC118462503 [Anopheles albimanus]XP_035784120.1 uncharacterized protein LOC118462503 [Anopheles albimanus]